MTTTKPKRIDVFPPKFLAEKEKQIKLDAIAFAKTLKPSKWLK